MNVWYQRAVSANELGRFADAEHCARQALAIEPDEVDAHYQLAFSFFRRQMDAPARDALTSVLERDPECVAALAMMGAICFRCRDSDALSRATKFYESALAVNATHFAAAMGLVNCYFKARRYREGAALVKRCAAEDPDHPWVLDAVARVGIFQKDQQSATAAVRRLQALAPDESETHWRSAEVALLWGKLEDAEQHTAEALRLQPNDVKHYGELLHHVRACRVERNRFG